MKRLLIISSLLSSSLIFSSAALAETTIYIQSLKARLHNNPAFSAKVVRTADRGSQFTLLEKKGSWYKISDSSGNYWVPKLVTSNHPPLNKVSILTSADAGLKENARRRASSVITAGAARGLTATSRSRINDAGSDFYSLRKVEAINIAEKELDQFTQASTEK